MQRVDLCNQILCDMLNKYGIGAIKNYEQKFVEVIDNKFCLCILFEGQLNNFFHYLNFIEPLMTGKPLLLVVHSSIKIPKKLAKISDKIIFYDSWDSMIDAIETMAILAKDIQDNG